MIEGGETANYHLNTKVDMDCVNCFQPFFRSIIFIPFTPSVCPIILARSTGLFDRERIVGYPEHLLNNWSSFFFIYFLICYSINCNLNYAHTRIQCYCFVLFWSADASLWTRASCSLTPSVPHIHSILCTIHYSLHF